MVSSCVASRRRRLARVGVAAATLFVGTLFVALPWCVAADAPAKPRGRLPSYFAQVVSADQKEQVYKVQGEYETQIDALEAQIAALEKKRDAAVRALLSPEQQRQVDELAAAAKAKRVQRKQEEKAAQSARASATPATPVAPAAPRAAVKAK